MNRLTFLLCLPMLLLPLCRPAWSAHQGVYVGAFYGLSVLNESEADDDQGTFHLDFDPGQVAVFTLGYDLNPKGLLGDGRIEFEYARRSNSLDKVDFLEGDVSGKGDLQVESLLLSTYGVYRGFRGWVPYFGAGIGAARVTADDLQVSGQPLADDDDVVFAYQLGVGADIPLLENLSLDLGYRFFGTTKPEFKTSGGDDFKAEYFSHAALVGLRLGF